MKNLILVGVALFSIQSSAALADAREVYQCVDGSQSMTVYQDNGGKLTGVLKDSHGTKRMTCEKVGRGNHFECTKGEYVAKIFRGASGHMTVQVELAGDFGPYDSGHLYSLNCK